MFDVDFKPIKTMKVKFTTLSSRFLTLIFLAAITNQCKTDFNSVEPVSHGYLTPNSMKDQLSVSVAKILAQKMTDQTVRNFIKKNVLKKFDEDYNVLFADSYPFFLDKDKDADLIESVLRDYPLMQIVVPELFTVMPEEWNTTTHIPLVAVVPENHQPDKDTLIGAYDSKGKLYMLSTRRDPKEHVVLISENTRTEFYLKGEEPTVDKIKSAAVGSTGCGQIPRIGNPESIASTSRGSYYLRKEIAAITNAVNATCSTGGGGGSNSGSSCERATLPITTKDVIGDMKFQSMAVLNNVNDFTGSAFDFKMDIDYGGINGSPVQSFAVFFFANRHTTSSCDFFFWCYPTQFNPGVPTLSWDKTTDGTQMKYTLWALGNGVTTTSNSTFTATGVDGTSLSYTISKTNTSKDKILGSDYVKYCEPALGQGTMYAIGQYVYFYIHR